MRFTHLYLENWRNFARADADLRRRAIVVGPNASGKTNLLDAFRFLHDLVRAGGGLEEAVRARGGVSRLRCLAARQHTHVAIAVHAGADGAGPEWEYELRFAQDSRKTTLCRERVTCDGEDLLSRPDAEDSRDSERLTRTCLEQVGHNQAFRELAAFFSSVRYVNPIAQLIREPERSTGRREDAFGGRFLQQVAATPEHTRRVRLRRVLAALNEAAPQLRDLQLWRDEGGWPHLRARYGHWRPRGAWQTETEFSDGTLRLVAILWAALESSGPLLVEEPETSLHAEVVRRTLSMLSAARRRSGGQLILSTHSWDLLSDAALDAEEVLALVPCDEGVSVVRPPLRLAEVPALLDGSASSPESGGETDEHPQLGLFDGDAPEPPQAPGA